MEGGMWSSSLTTKSKILTSDIKIFDVRCRKFWQMLEILAFATPRADRHKKKGPRDRSHSPFLAFLSKNGRSLENRGFTWHGTSKTLPMSSITSSSFQPFPKMLRERFHFSLLHLTDIFPRNPNFGSGLSFSRINRVRIVS